MVAASGGSTNGGLHLPAMANECGVAFSLRDVAEIFHRIALPRRPQAWRALPVAKDMGEAGGVPVPC